MVICIDAVPQGRPRFVKGKVIDPPKSRKFKAELATLIREQFHGEPSTSALRVYITFSRNFKSPTNRRYGDIDNLIKAVLDACNGILWKDDSQIFELTARKFCTDGVPYIVLSYEERHLLNLPKGDYYAEISHQTV